MNPQLLAAMALAGLMFVIAGYVLNRRLRRDEKFAARVRTVQSAVGIETVTAPADVSQSPLLRLVAGIGTAITRGGLLSAVTLEDLERRLSNAGFRGHNVLAMFVGAKLLTLIGLPLRDLAAAAANRVAVVIADDCGGGCGRCGPAAARLHGSSVARPTS